MPPAPGLFSTTTDWPSLLCIASRQNAADNVGAAAGAERDDDADRALRIVFSRRGRGQAGVSSKAAAKASKSFLMTFSP